MEFVTDVAQLDAVYGAPAEASLVKVADRLTPAYRKWIEASQFCVISTVGPEGVDGSPRGDDGPVVQELDEFTLAMPDWRGNNRIDSLRNIVRDPRIALMFMVAGSNNVVRVNGDAKVTFDEQFRSRFSDKGRLPRSVIVIKINEVYSQCARALMRANLWRGRPADVELPSVGDMLAELKAGFDGKTYDAAWGARAKDTMW
ncbi:pyridoxamine 5'-phosphate oxidase family protein [uncultured Litoreibacter sp.]|uniref:pyridoxamine 5'-phosphate oxidase family protein n=1 Tax=uncultured Litoreibacter sp. TaxID=1392394 RepID=UPI0026344506|nr:pyridoxamine 5'-phosphate oxidase family protein [uncultured Litoreibacter sp.]